MTSTSVAIHRNSAFKVPFPKKPRDNTCKAISGGDNCGRISTEVESVTFGANFLYLVQKLYTCPSALTANELMLLRKHPVIGQLIDHAARLNISVASFYVPVESILRPYASEKVQIYFRERIQIVIGETQKTQDDESVTSEQTAETVEPEPKIGFYTKKERMEKIKKFKEKKLRYLSNKNNGSIKYVNKSQAARKRVRVNGKFVKV